MADTRKLIELLNLTTDFFSERQIENPRLNAESLISFILGISRVQLYLNFEKPIENDEIQKIRAAIKRRANHEPLQYILGETEFFSLPFKVNRYTLIPRPETELLVEKMNEKIGQRTDISVLDIGTGSGNIVISLAKECKAVQATGIDIDENIIRVARENAALNGFEENIHFIVADICNPGVTNILHHKYDMIVSNPPYISESDFQKLPKEIRNFEPATALYGGEDGLKFYRCISKNSPALLKNGGVLGLETGIGQSDFVKNILQEQGFADIEIINDLNGIDRVVIARLNN